jgi:hypothetical protein
MWPIPTDDLPPRSFSPSLAVNRCVMILLKTVEKKLEDGKEEEKIVALDDTDIQILKTYVSGC